MKKEGKYNLSKSVDNEEAYGEGHQAYYDGYSLIHNPYKRNTEMWEEWRSGWLDEKHDDPYWEKVKKLKTKYTHK